MFVLRFKHIHFYKTGRGEPLVTCTCAPHTPHPHSHAPRTSTHGRTRMSLKHTLKYQEHRPAAGSKVAFPSSENCTTPSKKEPPPSLHTSRALGTATFPVLPLVST